MFYVRSQQKQFVRRERTVTFRPVRSLRAFQVRGSIRNWRKRLREVSLARRFARAAFTGLNVIGIHRHWSWALIESRCAMKSAHSRARQSERAFSGRDNRRVRLSPGNFAKRKYYAVILLSILPSRSRGDDRFYEPNSRARARCSPRNLIKRNKINNKRPARRASAHGTMEPGIPINT